MRPDGAGRHCSACSRQVYDLARLTRGELRGLMLLTGGKLCARQTMVDGELVLMEEPARPVRRRSARGWSIRAGVIAGALNACATVPEPAHEAPVATTTQEAGRTAPAPGGRIDCSKSRLAPAECERIAETVYTLESAMVMGSLHVGLPASVVFEPGSLTPVESVEATASDVAAFLRMGLGPPKVYIQGRATPPEAADAAALAAARAEIVRQALVRAGVAPERLWIVPPSEPAAGPSGNIDTVSPWDRAVHLSLVRPK